MTDRIRVIDLGLADYERVQTLQGRLRRAVVDGRLPGVLLLLEHPPVVTLGSRGGSEDLRPRSPEESMELPVCRAERGGRATLHAPGQLVSYPIVPLPRRDLRAYVAALEEVLIRLLADLGIDAHRSVGRPGLYVEDRKIASIGLRCERWVASHGTSLNVDVDLELFGRIVSCGEEHLRQTSILAERGRIPSMTAVKAGYVDAFAHVLPWRPDVPVSVTPDDVAAYLGLSEASALP